MSRNNETIVDQSIPLPADAGTAMPTPATEAQPDPAAQVINARYANSESYSSLVWRRFRRSFMGMVGLVLVVLMLVVAIFGDFFAPMDPKQTNIGFAPPDTMSFTRPDGSFSLIPIV